MDVASVSCALPCRRHLHCRPEGIITRIKRAAFLVELIGENEFVCLAIIALSSADVKWSVIINEFGEARNQRNLACGIGAAEIESAVGGLVALGVERDDRIAREQRDETQEEEDEAPNVRDTTKSEDRAASVVLERKLAELPSSRAVGTHLAVTLGVRIVEIVIGLGVIPAPAVACTGRRATSSVR